MGEKRLLDCTMRDGGYVNDWEFGHNSLINIFERLVNAGIDIIEVGFLDDRRPFDLNRSIFPDTESIENIWRNVRKRPPMVVGMIDYGTCSIKNLQLCSQSFLDGIRVIFKKQKMYEAMDFCKQVKALGYQVFSQLVSITAYSDDELLELVELANKVEPYAVSIVDTYGLLSPLQMLHYYKILDANLKSKIQIGFHAHNNLQMGYANAQAFLDKNTDRDILVDGTLFGMGKSAGNAPLELLAMRMNKDFGKEYHIGSMLEAIEESVKPIYINTPWGYNAFFYLSASNRCHPNYLNYYQKKGDLSQTKLDELLTRIEPEEKKLLYDEKLAEQLYLEYIKERYDDEAVYRHLNRVFSGRQVLLIGPGKNIYLQKTKVQAYIAEYSPIIIAINYLPEGIPVDYVFLTKASRYEQMADRAAKYSELKFIATSNIECREGKFDYVVMRGPLLEKKEQFVDNSFLMLLKVLNKAHVTNIACAGLDGYSQKEDNYINSAMEYDFVKGAAEFLNYHIRSVLREQYGDSNITFVTYSHYCDTEDINRAAY